MQKQRFGAWPSLMKRFLFLSIVLVIRIRSKYYKWQNALGLLLRISNNFYEIITNLDMIFFTLFLCTFIFSTFIHIIKWLINKMFINLN